MEKSYGKLHIRTYVANEALPIEGAEVLIVGADESNRDTMYYILTDVDGVTKEIILSTPGAIYSLSPEPLEQPYSTVDVTVSKEGFYTKKISGVPIFAGINALLPVNMIPIEEGSDYPIGNINAQIYENLYL